MEEVILSLTPFGDCGVSRSVVPWDGTPVGDRSGHRGTLLGHETILKPDGTDGGTTV